MSKSLLTGLQLVRDCIDTAIVDLDMDNKQQALHHIQLARRRLQELEADLYAKINLSQDS